MLIKDDPYKNRSGYRLQGFFSEGNIEGYFSKYFNKFSFGKSHNDYYGIHEQVFWVVCEKNKTLISADAYGFIYSYDYEK